MDIRKEINTDKLTMQVVIISMDSGKKNSNCSNKITIQKYNTILTITETKKLVIEVDIIIKIITLDMQVKMIPRTDIITTIVIVDLIIKVMSHKIN